MKVRDILKKEVDKLNKYNVEDAILKAQLLLQHILNISHEYLVNHYEDEVDKNVFKMFQKDINDLIKGKPVQYITNKQSFYGYDFYVDENVLIPQPDTECLVEEVIKISQKTGGRIKILDICTGSGAIAISIKKNIKAELVASDISPRALEVAGKNIESNKVKVKLIESDMFENIKGKFNIIVSNPPYIETNIIKNLSKEVKTEPKIALDGGEDGLEFYRILTKNAGDYLESKGVLAVEIGYDQKDRVVDLFKKNGFIDVYSKKDFGNNDRIVVGKWR